MKLEYNGVQICASNHVPSANVTSGDANYQGDFSNVSGMIWSPSCVASLTKQGIALATEDDVRRNSTLVIGSHYAGGGVLRPELASVFGGASLDRCVILYTPHAQVSLTGGLWLSKQYVFDSQSARVPIREQAGCHIQIGLE